jgi:hypothetical protein
MTIAGTVFYIFKHIIIFSSVYAFAKIAYQFTPIIKDYYYEEKIVWNSKMNPYKISIYSIVILIFLGPLLYNKYGVDIKNVTIVDLSFIIPIQVFIFIGIYIFLIDKIKSNSKGYEVKLEPVNLKDDKLIEMYNYAKGEEFFDIEFEVFKKILNLETIGEPILWKKNNKKNKNKDRQLLLSFLNDCLENQIYLSAIKDQDKCDFVNKYFKFDEFKDGKELILKTYTISDFKINILNKKIDYRTNQK